MRAPQTLLAGSLCLLLAACASSAPEEGESPKTGESASAPTDPIPITEEPDFSLPEGAELPAPYKGASAMIVGSDLDPLEQEVADAFAAELWAAGFKNVAESPDFVVRLHYEPKTEAFVLKGRPDVDAVIRAKGKVELEGSPARGSKTFIVSLKHDQPTSRAQDASMGEAHAAVVGRLLAKKLISKLAFARGPAVQFEYSLAFKGFDRPELREIRELVLGVKGVAAKDVREVSGRGVFILKLSSELAPAALRKAVSDALADNDLASEVASLEDTELLFTRQ